MTWNPPSRIHLQRWEAGRGSCPDGWVHRKTVPHAILAQVLAGSYALGGGVRTERIMPGEIAVVAAHRPVVFAHHRDTSGRMEIRFLHIEALRDGVVDPLSLHDTPTRLAGPAAGRIGMIIERLLGPDGQQVELAAALAQAALAEALLTLPQGHGAEARAAAAASLAGVLGWMRAHLAEPIAIADLMRVAGLSRSRLHAAFSSRVGRAPLAQLRELRLDEAARRLLVDDDSVASIAAVCGFADQYHLAHAFTRRYGMPPTRYRATQRMVVDAP